MWINIYQNPAMTGICTIWRWCKVHVNHYNVSYCHESICHKCVSYGCTFCTKLMRKIYVILGRCIYPEHATSLHFIYWEIGVGRVEKGTGTTQSPWAYCINLSPEKNYGYFHREFSDFTRVFSPVKDLCNRHLMLQIMQYRTHSSWYIFNLHEV